MSGATRIAGAWLAGALLAPLCPTAQSAPPKIEPGTVVDRYFGVAVDDPYRQLENKDDPKAAAWMRAQADDARAQLDAIPGRADVLRDVRKYEDAVPARVTAVRRRPGDLFFYEKRARGANQFKLYVRRGLRGTERLLVDPDLLQKQTGKPHAINYFEPSMSGRFVAYGLSVGGSEDAELYVIEAASGRRVMGPITRAQFGGVAWLADDSGFFMNRLQELKPGMKEIDKFQNSRAVFITLGTDPEQAPLALAATSSGIQIDPATDSPFVYPIPGTPFVAGQIAHGTDSEMSLYIASLTDARAGRAQWRKIVHRSDDVTAVEVVGDRLFALTHHGASRYRLVETSLAQPDFTAARELIAQSQGVLTGLVRAADALYVTRRDGAVSHLLRYPLKGGEKPRPLALPIEGSIELAGVDYRLPGVLATLQSWTRSAQIYGIDGGVARNTGLQPRGPFDAPTQYVSTEVLVPSHDGAQVPLSIIHRRDLKLDGSNPTLLYGYGSYGMTEEPWFSAWRLAWLERGGVFAVANPRGSGAFGYDWYKGGFQASKPDAWKDFIATAQYLIDKQYTRPEKLGIYGGSAGGILVGRAMTERPDLFAAVVASVGVMDTVRAELTPNGLPNIPEFGTHKTEEGFRALLEMSTYHHIRDGERYPAVLFTHGVNDPRVEVWESMKAAARLQQASASGRPILLRLDYDAGHGIGNTLQQRIAERADLISFLLWQFGVKGYQPQ